MVASLLGCDPAKVADIGRLQGQIYVCDLFLSGQFRDKLTEALTKGEE